MANIKKEEVKTQFQMNDQVLLTEAEFEKKQRLKAKERINRITRVFGVFTILLLSFAGIFEPFFELSYFGRLFTPTEHNFGWEQFTITEIVDSSTGEILKISPLFDDWLNFWNPWLAKIGITVLLIAASVFLIYFLTYTLVDLVDAVNELIATGKDLRNDLSGNIKDTMNLPEKEVPKTKKKKKKNLFEKDVEEKVEKKEKAERRRRTEKTDGFADLTSEQLDALLSGKPMEEVLGIDSSNEGKDLF